MGLVESYLKGLSLYTVKADASERQVVVVIRKDLLTVGVDLEGFHDRRGDRHGLEVLAGVEPHGEDSHLLVCRDRLARVVKVEENAELVQLGLLSEIKCYAVTLVQTDIVYLAFLVGAFASVEEQLTVGVREVQLCRLGQLGDISYKAG